MPSHFTFYIFNFTFPVMLQYTQKTAIALGSGNSIILRFWKLLAIRVSIKFYLYYYRRSYYI